MTKAELEVIIAELTAKIEALETTPAIAPTPTPQVDPPAPAAPDYGPYNANWCRAYQPLIDLLDEYENDGNRYHSFLVGSIDQTSGGGGVLGTSSISPQPPEGTPNKGKYGYTPRDAVYLVKPKSGFVNKEHETFFLRAYNGNRNRSHYLSKVTGFFKGRVFTAFRKQKWQLPFPWVVGLGTDFIYGEECPFAGTNRGDADKARELFETWWTKDKVLKYNWQRIVKLVHKLDKQYADGEPAESIQKVYPYWRPDDGSPAVF